MSSMPTNAGKWAYRARNSYRADVKQPDTKLPEKDTSDYPAIASFEDIMS